MPGIIDLPKSHYEDLEEIVAGGQGSFGVYWQRKSLHTYRWFSRYVITAMLVDENKRFLISSFCSSTSNCTLQHCYLCP